MERYPLVMLGSGGKLRCGSTPKFYSVLCCQCFVLLHPNMSTKHPSLSLASGEKRKALEMKLNIIAQL